MNATRKQQMQPNQSNITPEKIKTKIKAIITQPKQQTKTRSCQSYHEAAKVIKQQQK